MSSRHRDKPPEQWPQDPSDNIEFTPMSKYDPEFDFPADESSLSSMARSHGYCGCPPGTRGYHLKGCFVREGVRRVTTEDAARRRKTQTAYDQPPPVKNNHAPVWLSVINDLESGLAYTPLVEQILEDITERMNVGIERYGTTLQPFNGRNALEDAYAEALDMLVYLKQRILESADDGAHRFLMEELYESHTQSVLALRRLMGWEAE